MIKVKDTDFQEYAIRLDDFKELIGSTSNKTYEYVDVMTDELMKKPFKIGDEKFNWIYYARYHRGDNYVTLKIAPDLKPYLLALSSNFLKYNIANILPLRSAYVIRLYELCKDHLEESSRYKPKTSIVFDMKIDRLRELFEIPISYKYNDIRRHIIDKAVKQFKEKTDIQISYTEIKLGRKVDTLHITVKENNKGSNDYMSSKKAFVAWVRERYKPDADKGIYPTIFEIEDGKYRVDGMGKLYLSANSESGNAQDFDSTEANKKWSWLYENTKNCSIKLNKISKERIPKLEKKISNKHLPTAQQSLFSEDELISNFEAYYGKRIKTKKGTFSITRIASMSNELHIYFYNYDGFISVNNISELEKILN
jgi:plasmid replication initiation protein